MSFRKGRQGSCTFFHPFTFSLSLSLSELPCLEFLRVCPSQSIAVPSLGRPTGGPSSLPSVWKDQGPSQRTINGYRKCRLNANPEENSAHQMIMQILLMVCLDDAYDSWFLLLQSLGEVVLLAYIRLARWIKTGKDGIVISRGK